MGMFDRRPVVHRAGRHLLHARVDFGVPNGGVQADVAEPTANHIDVDARFEEMDRGGVSIMASFP
jgi:hypothetical protein